MLRICQLTAILTLLMLGAWEALVVAQEAEEDRSSEVRTSAIPPLVLDISRRSLKNFLTDEASLEPYRMADGSIAELEEAFMIGSPEGRHALIWDTLACRLVGVLDLAPTQATEPVVENVEGADKPQPDPYVLKANGKPPFSDSRGAFESPNYFGFRVIDGLPEFLYTHGSLQIEERLWLESDGNVMKQRFVVKNADSDISIRFEESWLDRIESNVGSWRNGMLTVPSEDLAEILLTYQLARSTEGEEDSSE